MAKYPALNIPKSSEVKSFGDAYLRTTNSLNRGNKELGKSSAAFAELKKGLDKISSGLNGLKTNITAGLIGFTGLGLGIKSLFGTAWQLNREIINWRNNFNYLSDSTGDTTKAIGLMTGVFNTSLGSLSEIQSAMGALASQGMNVGSEMKDLTGFITDMHRAAGISVDQLAKMTGGMVSYWGVSAKGSRVMVSSILAAGKAFNNTKDQMEALLSVVNENVEVMGALFIDGEQSAKALAKGVSMVGGAMMKMGVTAKTATDFVNKMLDPDKFGETNTLMRMLGVSVEEQFKMWESASGKEMFFDKLLTNLPTLAQRIQAIQNPLARMQFAETIGLPREIAAKMANASQSQMADIIRGYKQEAQDEKAAEEKRKKAAEANAKIEDRMQLFKMQVLLPLMDWTMKMYQQINKWRAQIAPTLTKFTGAFTKFLDGAVSKLVPIVDALLSGDPKKLGAALGDAFKGLAEFLVGVLKTVGPALQEAFKGASEFIKPLAKELGPVIGSVFKDIIIPALKEMFLALPGWAQFGLVTMGILKILPLLGSLNMLMGSGLLKKGLMLLGKGAGAVAGGVKGVVGLGSIGSAVGAGLTSGATGVVGGAGAAGAGTAAGATGALAATGPIALAILAAVGVAAATKYGLVDKVINKSFDKKLGGGGEAIDAKVMGENAAQARKDMIATSAKWSAITVGLGPAIAAIATPIIALNAIDKVETAKGMETLWNEIEKVGTSSKNTSEILGASSIQAVAYNQAVQQQKQLTSELESLQKKLNVAVGSERKVLEDKIKMTGIQMEQNKVMISNMQGTIKEMGNMKNVFGGAEKAMQAFAGSMMNATQIASLQSMIESKFGLWGTITGNIGDSAKEWMKEQYGAFGENAMKNLIGSSAWAGATTEKRKQMMAEIAIEASKHLATEGIKERVSYYGKAIGTGGRADIERALATISGDITKYAGAMGTPEYEKLLKQQLELQYRLEALQKQNNKIAGVTAGATDEMNKRTKGPAEQKKDFLQAFLYSGGLTSFRFIT